MKYHGEQNVKNPEEISTNMTNFNNAYHCANTSRKESNNASSL